MRKIKVIVIFFCFSAFICSCGISKNNEVNKMSNTSDGSVHFLDMRSDAPRATTIQPLNNVDKIMVDGNNLQLAIDIENQWMSNSSLNLLGINNPEYFFKPDETDELFEIFVKYDLQNWNAEYNDPSISDFETEPYAMYIFLLYQDGTVEEHRIYTSRHEYAPPNYYEFLDELKKWVYKRIPRVKPGGN